MSSASSRGSRIGSFPSKEERGELLNTADPADYPETIKQQVVDAIIDGRLIDDLTRHTSHKDAASLAVWLVCHAILLAGEGEVPSADLKASIERHAARMNACALQDFTAQLEAYVRLMVAEQMERIGEHGIKAY